MILTKKLLTKKANDLYNSYCSVRNLTRQRRTTRAMSGLAYGQGPTHCPGQNQPASWEFRFTSGPTQVPRGEVTVLRSCLVRYIL